ncbi:MAG: stage II sporulation protein M [Candidatus Hydrogenedentes bacterium]|nr:stage II sporulation protein M [Candidatus Hydrogenedentota bacterium]
MIVDLEAFVAAERPYWDELGQILRQLEEKNLMQLDLPRARRFYYLYRRAASDLARLQALAIEPSIPEFLDDSVARAYAEIHETRRTPVRFQPLSWFRITFPVTFRRHATAFQAAVLITLAGSLLGAAALAFDPQAKAVIMPFPGLLKDPTERVRMEEETKDEDEAGPRADMALGRMHASFASMLMTNNIRVSIMALALGITFGFGTVVVLFYNGVMLGAVVFDYVRAGQTEFLAGWLLPHGVVEIPAILLAGQAGLVLAGAVIGWHSSLNLRERMRKVGPDLVTIIGGVAVMLVWAGLVESFFSQYHAPVFPYPLKIAFGLFEFVLLVIFLTLSGRAVGRPATGRTDP